MDFIGLRTTIASPHASRLLTTIIRLAVMTAAGIILLTMVLVGFFVVLPLMLVGGIASYFYLRRRVRRTRQRPQAEVIDAEYTVIDHR
ncbi:hypothetical protein AA309_29790 [Microvirga vignae]|uniref:Uncharacterized protein n=1 Tax=Microvirga vignae TaxID=1225564 RepID=A0A0H1R3B9_9HYPH|nr:hypothetical protein [Microvirga vignae]KLK89710.1 hypothetical protein AA309_29790 [Microvirga vignae]